MDPASASAAREINRLDAEVEKLSAASRQSLTSALAAAWQAGQLLIVEKRRVRRAMGPGAWVLWLEQNFHGAKRTAQKYMQLARAVPDASALEGMGLRQMYLHLGIATEPKSRAESPHVEPLPPHVRLAHKLLVVLEKSPPPEQCATIRQDLRALYERLRRFFEPNFASPSRSNQPEP